MPPVQLIQKAWQEVPAQQIWHQSIPKSALLICPVELSVPPLMMRWWPETLHLVVAVCMPVPTEHLARWNSGSENQNCICQGFLAVCIFAFGWAVLEIDTASAQLCRSNFAFLSSGRSRNTNWLPCICLFIKSFFRGVVPRLYFFFLLCFM